MRCIALKQSRTLRYSMFSMSLLGLATVYNALFFITTILDMGGESILPLAILNSGMTDIKCPPADSTLFTRLFNYSLYEPAGTLSLIDLSFLDVVSRPSFVKLACWYMGKILGVVDHLAFPTIDLYAILRLHFLSVLFCLTVNSVTYLWTQYIEVIFPSFYVSEDSSVCNFASTCVDSVLQVFSLATTALELATLICDVLRLNVKVIDSVRYYVNLFVSNLYSHVAGYFIFTNLFSRTILMILLITLINNALLEHCALIIRQFSIIYKTFYNSILALPPKKKKKSIIQKTSDKKYLAKQFLNYITASSEVILSVLIKLSEYEKDLYENYVALRIISASYKGQLYSKNTPYEPLTDFGLTS